MGRYLPGTVLGAGLVVALHGACALDFDRFEPQGGSGEGGTPTPDAAPSDGSPVTESGAGDSGDRCGNCTRTFDSCNRSCETALDQCRSQCKGSGQCRDACDKKRQDCIAKCGSDCNTCAQGCTNACR